MKVWTQGQDIKGGNYAASMFNSIEEARVDAVSQVKEDGVTLVYIWPNRIDENGVNQPDYSSDFLGELLKRYNCPDGCSNQLEGGGPFDNPHSGGCAIDDKFPANTEVENDTSLPICPFYNSKGGLK